MEPPFSVRIGVRKPKTVLQLNSMDNDLRNGLWNVCYEYRLDSFQESYFYPSQDAFVRRLWHSFFKLPVDELRDHNGHMLFNKVKDWYSEANWASVYDFVEFVASDRFTKEGFVRVANFILEREMSGYRFSGYQLVLITNTEELEALQKASALEGPLTPVSAHIDSAISLFADRQNPDYRNSIKESISAVEAMCKIMTGDKKGTLGQALKKLEDKGIELHAALKSSFSSLYGYTNDAEGIRHALLEEPNLDFDDAKVMLVSCSAFVNYLAAKASKVGLFPS